MDGTNGSAARSDALMPFAGWARYAHCRKLLLEQPEVNECRCQLKIMH